MVACIGPLATIDCEPGQARKGAAAAVDSGAGVWLATTAAQFRDEELTAKRAKSREGITEPLLGETSCTSRFLFFLLLPPPLAGAFFALLR